MRTLSDHAKPILVLTTDGDLAARENPSSPRTTRNSLQSLKNSKSHLDSTNRVDFKRESELGRTHRLDPVYLNTSIMHGVSVISDDRNNWTNRAFVLGGLGCDTSSYF